jgi:hypothetical protein
MRRHLAIREWTISGAEGGSFEEDEEDTWRS